MIKGRLEAILQAVQTIEATITANPPITLSQTRALSVHFSEAKKKFADYEGNLFHVLELDSKDAPEAGLLQDQNTIGELFLQISVLVETLKPALEPTTPQSPVSEHIPHYDPAPSIRLPKMSLPNFNGDVTNWISFINLYDTSIHNNVNLSPVYKMQYLLSCLKGEALTLVSPLQISATNYLIAYNLLKERYHNSRRLLTLHLNAILDLPAITSRFSKPLRQFIDTLHQNTEALKALQTDIVSNGNPLLSAHLLRKMDLQLRQKLETHRNEADPHSLPSVQEIMRFLTEECNVSEDVSLHGLQPRSFDGFVSTQSKPSKPSFGPFKTSPQKQASMVSTQNSCSEPSNNACFVCHQAHRVYSCDKFRSLTPHERYNLIKQQKRCTSCLGNHELQKCQSKSTCRQCNMRHHTMLHFDRESHPIKNNANSPPTTSTAPHSQNTQSSTLITTADQGLALASQTLNESHQGHTTVVLGTCLVKLTAPNGNSHVFRALLDCASMTDFITERAAQLLGSPRQKSHLQIAGISQTTTYTRGMLPLTVKTLNDQALANNYKFHVLDNITMDLPRSNLTSEVVNRARAYVLADPTFHIKSKIDVLIGGNLFPHLLTGQNYSLGKNMPTIVSTSLGHVVMGEAPCIDHTCSITSHISTSLVSTQDMDLHEQLQKFWIQQEVPEPSQKSADDSLCDEHFSRTHTRNEEGRYVVSLPFRPDAPALGESYNSAKNRFYALERKFNAQTQFKAKYVDFMRDYALSGHMIKLETPNLDSPHYFIPHHGVFKQHGHVSKLRTVFDASAKTSTTVSLNDTLLTGEKLQTNICDIILNFRTHNVVFSCDIRQMYRQIKVKLSDQSFQRILWRENSSDPLQCFQLTTVTYGMNCSPYLALRTLRQLATDEGHHHPAAASILLQDTYVDDIISGASTQEEALKLQQDLISLLNKGGFELRKWCSNSERLLQAVEDGHRETPVFFEESTQPQYSVLGLHWCPESDTFSYLVDFSVQATTKRQVLSMIAKLYDPCGFLSPVTMWCKSYMQCLWAQGIQWDEPIPPSLVQKWQSFISRLSHLSQLTIPRAFQLSQAICVQMHGFSDASESGYAAVVYLRCQLSDNSIITRQLMAKTRVAPLKKVTLPRLELCGAHLLAQLVAYCLSTLKCVNISAHYLWCDSTVALSWLTTPAFKLKTYVANRVAQTQEIVPSHWWHHISSTDNPADCASRGLLPSDLPGHDLWWNGPSWLSLPVEAWPISRFEMVNLSSTGELKDNPLPVLLEVDLDPPMQEWNLLLKFSSWTTLLRVTAYVQRFISNLKNPGKKTLGPLSVPELNKAHDCIIRLVQVAEYSTDIKAIKAKRPSSGRLASLSPFIDHDGLLRVGGRLGKSSLHFDAKHPLLLPKKHHVPDLLITHYHVNQLHAGPQLTQAIIARRYWIVCARSRIRNIINRCLTCFKHKPRHITPYMADLPPSRVTPSKPFSSTGMDFCGPFNIKIITLRSNKVIKVYLCIFICLVVKAVHIEVVTDLSTPAFLAALTRFTCRRGLCLNLYSDCGTNFVGANAELKRIISTLKSQDSKEQIAHFATSRKINFHFNPPSAPHFGGLWESAVKSAKHHIYRALGDHILTLPEFTTLAVQVEAMLNSRPLTPLSADPNNLQALTPAHFLIGEPLTALPEPPLHEEPITRLQRFQLVQAFHQRIWRRWLQEYLHTLMQRRKWTKSSKNLQVNDLVLLQTLTPPLTWPLGRITAVHPGQDGIVRVVEVTTATGTYKRPVVKVHPLPQEE